MIATAIQTLSVYLFNVGGHKYDVNAANTELVQNEECIHDDPVTVENCDTSKSWCQKNSG